MWYGVLGTKELVQKTYKNLEQRVQLEVSIDKCGRTYLHTHLANAFIKTTVQLLGIKPMVFVCVWMHMYLFHLSGHGFMFHVLF